MMNDKSCPQTPHHLPNRQGRGIHAAQHVWFSSRPWINNKLVSFNVFVHYFNGFANIYIYSCILIINSSSIFNNNILCFHIIFYFSINI